MLDALRARKEAEQAQRLRDRLEQLSHGSPAASPAAAPALVSRVPGANAPLVTATTRVKRRRDHGDPGCDGGGGAGAGAGDDTGGGDRKRFLRSGPRRTRPVSLSELGPITLVLRADPCDLKNGTSGWRDHSRQKVKHDGRVYRLHTKFAARCVDPAVSSSHELDQLRATVHLQPAQLPHGAIGWSGFGSGEDDEGRPYKYSCSAAIPAAQSPAPRSRSPGGAAAAADELVFDDAFDPVTKPTFGGASVPPPQPAVGRSPGVRFFSKAPHVPQAPRPAAEPAWSTRQPHDQDTGAFPLGRDARFPPFAPTPDGDSDSSSDSDRDNNGRYGTRGRDRDRERHHDRRHHRGRERNRERDRERARDGNRGRHADAVTPLPRRTGSDHGGEGEGDGTTPAAATAAAAEDILGIHPDLVKHLPDVPDDECDDSPRGQVVLSFVVHAALTFVLSGLFLLVSLHFVTLLQRLEDFAAAHGAGVAAFLFPDNGNGDGTAFETA